MDKLIRFEVNLLEKKSADRDTVLSASGTNPVCRVNLHYPGFKLSELWLYISANRSS